MDKQEVAECESRVDSDKGYDNCRTQSAVCGRQICCRFCPFDNDSDCPGRCEK